MPKEADLLKMVLRYCAAHRIRESAFGRLVLGDPNFVSDLRRGRSPRMKTAERVIGFINRKGADK